MTPLKILVNRVCRDIQKELDKWGFIQDSEKVWYDRDREKIIKKSIEDYTRKRKKDYWTIKERYFDKINRQLDKYLYKNYKFVCSDEDFYFYNKKYEFKDCQELERFFGLDLDYLFEQTKEEKQN